MLKNGLITQVDMD